MKTLTIALALLAATTVSSAFAEGGADRLRERSDQWAAQRQQAQEAVAKREAEQGNRQADVPRTEAKPAS